MKNLKQDIANKVEQSSVLSFACVNGDKPYQVWMHYAGDMERIIVYSRRNRLHSEFVKANSNVSVAVLPEQIPGYGVIGLSGQGTIRELTEEGEVAAAERLYCAKFMRDDIGDQARSGNADEHALWEIKIDSYVLFDTHNYADNPRQEYTL